MILIGRTECSLIIDNDSVCEHSLTISVEPASMEGIQRASEDYTRTYQSLSDKNKLHIVFGPNLSLETELIV